MMPQSVDATPAALTELFFSDTLLDAWVKCTNEYAASRLSPVQQKKVDKAEILKFLATICYMGVVVLPAKTDYFVGPDHPILPIHHAIKLSLKRFEYMWRNFHTSYKAGNNGEDIMDDNVEDDVDDSDLTDTVEHPPLEAGEDEDTIPVDLPQWVDTVSDFMSHVNKVSKTLCKHPSWNVSIDEMMKKFKGRSAQTHKMPRKPAKKGYKFYSLCCSQTGYVYDFYPSGRLENTKIKDAVERLLDTLPKKEHLQYCVTMDNFFTTVPVIKAHIERGLGIIGTARRRHGWPCSEMRRVDDNRFNSLYCLNEKEGYMTMRWIDNGEVLMITNMHTGMESVERERKRPRITNINKRNVLAIWGNDPVKKMEIPAVIDDYNHFMGGVDKADQLIQSYRPDIRCRRTWMPIFLHCMDIARIIKCLHHS
jgi:hypothetical protein